jgi:hypothetical protein
MPSRNPVTATIALLALPGANAFLSTCGDAKGDYRGSTCCGNPGKTLQSLENICPDKIIGTKEALVIEQKEKGYMSVPTKTILGAATFGSVETGAFLTSAELDAMMDSTAPEPLAAIKAGYAKCAHLDAKVNGWLADMAADGRAKYAVGDPDRPPDILPNFDYLTYAAAPTENPTTVRAWGQLVAAKYGQSMMGLMGTPGLGDGGFFVVMANICPMHSFYLKGMCGADGAHCQATMQNLGEDVAYIMETAYKSWEGFAGKVSSGKGATPMSDDTNSGVSLVGSIETVAAMWESAFVFPSGFLYAHAVKKVYTCTPGATSLFSPVKYHAPTPQTDLDNNDMTTFADSPAVFSKVTKLWNLQQAYGFQIELMKRTKQGFFNVQVSAARDLQFLHLQREHALFARDCEFPDSDALIWEPVDDDGWELGMAHYEAHPGFDATRFDPNQPLEWLVKAQNYYPATENATTGLEIPHKWNGTATLNNGFKELKMYGKMEYGMVKKILADVDCTLMFVVNWAKPDSPTVPFPPSRDFSNTGCTLPDEKEWNRLGRSAGGKRAKKARHPLLYRVWDKF